MTSIGLVAGALLTAAEPAPVAPAPPVQAHQQRQASGQHRPDAASGAPCCCEEMMRKMMMEMMRKHQGRDMSQPATAETPEPEDRKH